MLNTFREIIFSVSKKCEKNTTQIPELWPNSGIWRASLQTICDGVYLHFKMSFDTLPKGLSQMVWQGEFKTELEGERQPFQTWKDPWLSPLGSFQHARLQVVFIFSKKLQKPFFCFWSPLEVHIWNHKRDHFSWLVYKQFNSRLMHISRIIKLEIKRSQKDHDGLKLLFGVTFWGKLWTPVRFITYHVCKNRGM